jgi:8-oxo-dGTP pyrophosphatase MutT (NUDIX family)
MPRAAATLLLLRDNPFRVLTVTRNARSFFPSATVFPGGLVEEEDSSEDWNNYLVGHEDLTPHDRALRIAACRETWEETLIAACCTTPFSRSDKQPDDPFRRHLHGRGARLDINVITPFARWITPPEMERRYDTHMFVSKAPDDAQPFCDGDEIVSCEWLEPQEAIARAHDGDPAILFSTYFNMSLLAQAQSVDTAIAMAMTRPLYPIIPRMVDDADGSWVKIDERSGYPVTRALIQSH